MSETWADQQVGSLEDVIEKEYDLMKLLEAAPSTRVEDLVKKGLIPEEKPYEVSAELRKALQMDAS